MSDEASNAATQATIDSFNAAKDAKARLLGQMKAVGESFVKIGEALQCPENLGFEIANNYVAVTDSRVQSSRPVANATPQQIDWQNFVEMLRGYTKAREDKKLAVNALKSMGIPIADD